MDARQAATRSGARIHRCHGQRFVPQRASSRERERERGVSFDKKLLKPKLNEIIQKEKRLATKRYEVDEMLAKNGHSVLRLPPYHCVLNPLS